MRRETSMITPMLCSMTTSAVPAAFNSRTSATSPGMLPEVHAPRHLVEEQEARLGRERAGQLEALALAGGEHARVRLRLVGEPDALERFERPQAGARDRSSSGKRPP